MVAALADGLDGCRLRDLFRQARKRHRGRRHDRAASRRRSVAASWNLIDIRTAEFAGVFFMADAVTNEQGEFALPAWGPRGITGAIRAGYRARWIMPSPICTYSNRDSATALSLVRFPQ